MISYLIKCSIKIDLYIFLNISNLTPPKSNFFAFLSFSTTPLPQEGMEFLQIN